MSERRPAVTIMIHRDGAIESRRVRLPLWLVRSLLVTGGVSFVLIVLGATLYAPIVRTAARVPSMQREIARLRDEAARVARLEETLTDMEARYAQVRSMLGASPVPAGRRLAEGTPVARRIMARAPDTAARYPQGLSAPVYWPLEEPGFVTRGPVAGGGSAESHAGLDVAVPNGTPIRAAGGGVVIGAGEDAELGLYVRLLHPDEFESVYGHASRLVVAAGDTVAAGEVIALSGSTGRSTAPHLHFEVRRRGRSIDPRSLVSEGT